MNRWTVHRRLRFVALAALLLGLNACRSREPVETEVEVRSIGFDSVSHSPVVVLQDHDRRRALPIWIGSTEAQAIAAQLEGVTPPRPMTHDLMKSILDGTGVVFKKVVIGEVKENTYFAHIHLDSGRKHLEFDSRPSDAIALALRFQSPIFVTTTLLKGDNGVDLMRQVNNGSTTTINGVTVQNLTDELADYFSLPPGRGVLVAEVHDRDGNELQRGDVILSVDGKEITGIGDFENKMRGVERGKRANLSVQRGSKEVQVHFDSPRG